MIKVDNKIISIFFVFLCSHSFAQLDSVYYQGPALGSVPAGVMVNTNNFVAIQLVKNPKVISGPKMLMEQGEAILNLSESELPDYYYVEDKITNNDNRGNGGQTVLLNSWNGNDMTNSWPPDPDLAVGPNHIITTVNSEFTIWDKEGSMIKTIDADQWCLQVFPNPGAFDPQIIYDFYESRWFMLWDARSSSVENSYIISYSDDSDPNGVWYSYAINANMNGNTSTDGWADYPKVGFDDEAIYITSNQFANSGSGFTYVKIRIISKAELYNSNGGPLSWNDIWDIRTPGQGAGGQTVFTIQPTVSFTNGNNGYFIWAHFNGANYYSIFKISNVTSTPWLRGQTIPVQFYGRAPNANQLGGGVPLEAINGSQMNTKMVVRDGFLYAVHPIRNSTNSSYSSLKYFKIDITNATIVEQAEFGAIGYFYLCPILTVDKDHNIAITYSRSGNTEYAGGYYSTKYNGDPPGLSSSQLLVAGQGNYVRTEQRNRWGDYHGIYLDPTNEYDVWIFPEYVAETNIWGTYLGQIRMVPFPGVYLFTQSTILDFGDLEIGTNPTTEMITISNYGEDDLVINDITSPAGPFTLLSPPTFPVTLSTYDSLDLEIEFDPATPAIYSELMAFDDNDPSFDGLILNGTGFEISPAFTGVLYSSTGPTENGIVLNVNMNNGVGTELGPSNYDELKSLTVDPVTNILYGISSGSSETELVRVNATGGDAFTQYTLDLGSMVGIAFDASGILYGAVQSGDIYTIDLSNGSYTLVTTANIQLTAITFNQITDQMWAVPRIVIGVKDKIYTIDLTTGEGTLVGQTGFGLLTNDLAFDENEILYGVIGGAAENGQLITINTTDASGTLVGDVGFQNVVGLAYSINGDPTSVESGDDTKIPNEYSLSQNYPNPFNPETSIKFSVPVDAKVTLTIYNLLGQVVTTLVNEEVTAGHYSAVWNGADANGFHVSSGIYFYEMKANGNDGRAYSQMKKMVLLK